MDFYMLVFIVVAILVVVALAGVLWFINWLSNKIDKKDRLGKQSETGKEEIEK